MPGCIGWYCCYTSTGFLHWSEVTFLYLCNASSYDLITGLPCCLTAVSCTAFRSVMSSTQCLPAVQVCHPPSLPSGVRRTFCRQPCMPCVSKRMLSQLWLQAKQIALLSYWPILHNDATCICTAISSCMAHGKGAHGPKCCLPPNIHCAQHTTYIMCTVCKCTALPTQVDLQHLTAAVCTGNACTYIPNQASRNE